MCSSGLCCPASPLPGMGMDALFRGACSAYPGKKKQAMIPARVSEMSGSRAELVPTNEFCEHGKSVSGGNSVSFGMQWFPHARAEPRERTATPCKAAMVPAPRQSFRSLCRRLPRRSRSREHGRARPPALTPCLFKSFPHAQAEPASRACGQSGQKSFPRARAELPPPSPALVPPSQK